MDRGIIGRGRSLLIVGGLALSIMAVGCGEAASGDEPATTVSSSTTQAPATTTTSAAPSGAAAPAPAGVWLQDIYDSWDADIDALYPRDQAYLVMPGPMYADQKEVVSLEDAQAIIDIISYDLSAGIMTGRDEFFEAYIPAYATSSNDLIRNTKETTAELMQAYPSFLVFKHHGVVTSFEVLDGGNTVDIQYDSSIVFYADPRGLAEEGPLSTHAELVWWEDLGRWGVESSS